jgi:hypothetical protein
MTEINIILNSNFEEINKNIEVIKNDKIIFYDDINRTFNLNKHIGISNISNYKINYYQIMNDLIYNDDILEYYDSIDKLDTDIKKIVIKKILEFSNPIISRNNIDNPIKNSIYNKLSSELGKGFNKGFNKDFTKFLNKPLIKNIKQNIINKNDIYLNYNIDGLYYIEKKQEKKWEKKKDNKSNKSNNKDNKDNKDNKYNKSNQLNTIQFKNYIIPSNNSFSILGLYNKDKYNINIPYKFNNLILNFNNILNDFYYSLQFNLKNNLNDNLKYKNALKFQDFEEFKDNYYNIVDYDKIDIKILKNFYQYLVNKFFLYINNKELIDYIHNDIKKLPFKYELNESFINYHLLEDTLYKKLNNGLYIKNNIKYINNVDKLDTFINNSNNFLIHKIPNSFNNSSYFSYYNNDLLSLYENIKLYSLDDKKNQDIISELLSDKENTDKYNKNKLELIKQQLINNRLELITKKKFPNLFNPNSSEYLIITKYPGYTFNINDIPNKYQQVILLEYNKLVNYISEYEKNKCIHKELVHNFNKNINMQMKQNEFKKILDLIDNKVSQGKEVDYNSIYKCIICSYNLICPHVIEYYSLLFSNDKKYQSKIEYEIQQKILNKYMTNAPVNMIYYCKVCGEELGKSLDLEKNIEFQDKVRLNTSEYSDGVKELIYSNTAYIVYKYILFADINAKLTKKDLIQYIINKITIYIYSIEKKIRLSSSLLKYSDSYTREDHIKNAISFNINLIIYATIINLMVDNPNIIFNVKNEIKKYKNIIKKTKDINEEMNTEIEESIDSKIEEDIEESIDGKVSEKSIVEITGSRSNKLVDILKIKFKEAFQIIYDSNIILINKLEYNKNIESIKELLIKYYSLVNSDTNVNTIQSYEKSEYYMNYVKNNLYLDLLKNSNIVNYLNNIQNIYPINCNAATAEKESQLYLFYLNEDNKYNKTIISKSKFIPSNEYTISNLEKILNIKLTNLNKKGETKINELFNNFTIPNYCSNANTLNNALNNLDNIKKINNFNEYKYISFISFYYHILFNLYNISIFNFITFEETQYSNLYIDNIKPVIEREYSKYSKSYITYIKLCQLIKKYELNLINKNITFNLYPYSHIKENNKRYFIYYFNTNKISLNLYFCEIDANPHKFNIYIFKTSENKEIEVNKKDLDSFINNNKNLKFIDYKCSKCKKIKNVIRKNSMPNDDIKKLINHNNDINGFFNLYINKCPVNNYHLFENNFSKKDKTNELVYSCKFCNIKFDDLISKNKDVFHKYESKYNEYKSDKNKYTNSLLKEFDIHISNLNTINNIETYKNEINLNIKNNKEIKKSNYNKEINNINEFNFFNYNSIDEIIKIIDGFNYDDVLINFQKIFNIDILYLNLIGLTEGYSYNKLQDLSISYMNIDNRLIKIKNYIRYISIIYNMVQNIINNKINITSSYFKNLITDTSLLEIINELTTKLSHKNISENKNINSSININNLYNYINIINKDNKYIIQFGIKLIYLFIISIQNKDESNNYSNLIKFIISKILKFDELFTNYNYYELKQMFNQDSFDDMFESNDVYNDDDDDDEFDLFEYNDVNVNFEDEDTENI